MSAADTAFMRGFSAALDLAERAGTTILAGQWGHAVRREHAAAGLLYFAEIARFEMRMANEMDAGQERSEVAQAFRPRSVRGPDTSVTVTFDDLGIDRRRISEWRDIRDTARLRGYVGEACPECANFTLVRNGTCLKCDTCGSTTGCS